MLAPQQRLAEPPLPALRVVAELFGRLDAAGVAYCHWKSNEHLAAGLMGLTDLDVLVDRRAGSVVTGVLVAAGFKRCAAVPDRAYAGIEDHLALDWDTGRLVHLHLHHRLAVGDKHLKGYHLPWEDLVLSTRQFDSAVGTFVADPHVELVVLVVRLALKIRTRDVLRAAVAPQTPVAGGAGREFLWLAERVQPTRLREIAARLIGAPAAEALLQMVGRRQVTLASVLTVRRRVASVVRRFRTYGRVAAALGRWRRRWRARQRSLARALGVDLPRRRVLPGGGVLIALVGADGSGKSTLARIIAEWLEWKLDVIALYFGSGDGSVSWLRRPLWWIREARRRAQPAAPGPREDRDPTAPNDSPRRRLWRVLWAIAVAREKRRRLERARRARNRGIVVVCDRFPQSQIPGVVDGPLLYTGATAGLPLGGRLAAWELATYRLAALCPPDLVVKLHVTPEVAARRKGAGGTDLGRRAAAVRTLDAAAATRVVDVDADQPIERVLLDVKRAVWQAL